MTEYPGLVLSVNDTRLVASLCPSEERPSLDMDALRALLTEAGYGKWQLLDDSLVALIGQYIAGKSDFEIQIGECHDASFTLEIAPDAMQVWTNVVPACGGKATIPDEIYLALGEAGVTFGIDQALVGTACEATEAAHLLVAAGTAAEDGENARFEMLIADVRDRVPQADEHGLIDFRELGAIPTVTAEQPLMRRIPPTTGTVGRNVRGVVLEPKPGRDASFNEKLVGAYIDPADKNLLRAVFNGQPVHCGNGVTVEQVLHVRDVNMATGNITFDGTVDIEGEVLPGMKVHATGDILVAGVVDGAELIASGDVRVGGGIIAKAHVTAGGSVAARFVESAKISAGTTIAIDDTALQSDLQANNQIVVGVKSLQRGRLAGGSARAMMLISTPILGAPTSGVTSLLLGVNPVLEAQYQDLLHTIEKRREDEQNLEKLVKHLEKKGDKTGMLERAKGSWQQSLQAWAKLLPERDDLERKLAQIAEAKIEIGVSVAGAVDMTFGKKILHLRKTYDAGTLSMVEDRIVFADPAGNVSSAG